MNENTLHQAVKQRYSNTPHGAREISEIGHIERVEEAFTLSTSPVPKVAKLNTKGAILGYDFHQAKSVIRVSTWVPRCAGS